VTRGKIGLSTGLDIWLTKWEGMGRGGVDRSLVHCRELELKPGKEGRKK
jgi:hypothetical protein